MESAFARIQSRLYRSRQYVTHVEENHVGLRGSRRARRHEPWLAVDVGILGHQLQRAMLGRLPERVRISEGELLDRPVVGTGRSGITVADESAALRGIAATDFYPAIIGV